MKNININIQDCTLLDNLPVAQPRVNNVADYIVFILGSIGSISNIETVNYNSVLYKLSFTSWKFCANYYGTIFNRSI